MGFWGIILGVGLALLSAACGWFLNNRFGSKSLEATRKRADETVRNARREAEKAKRAAVRSIREGLNHGTDVGMEIFLLGQQIGEAFAPRKFGQKGGRPRHFTDEQLNRLVGEWDSTHEDRDGMQESLALDLGVDPSTVSKRLTKLRD